MAVFDGVKASLLTAEGGEVNNPNDYGHLTKFGISQQSYPNVDIANLTFDDACVIYKRDYWDKYNLGDIEHNFNSQEVANQIFLLLINMEPHQAVKIIQKAVLSIENTNLVIDGILGSNTLAAIEEVTDRGLPNAITVEAVKFYLARTDADPSQAQFLRSWIRRSLLR